MSFRGVSLCINPPELNHQEDTVSQISSNFKRMHNWQARISSSLTYRSRRSFVEVYIYIGDLDQGASAHLAPSRRKLIYGFLREKSSSCMQLLRCYVAPQNLSCLLCFAHGFVEHLASRDRPKAFVSCVSAPMHQCTSRIIQDPGASSFSARASSAAGSSSASA